MTPPQTMTKAKSVPMLIESPPRPRSEDEPAIDGDEQAGHDRRQFQASGTAGVRPPAAAETVVGHRSE